MANMLFIYLKNNKKSDETQDHNVKLHWEKCFCELSHSVLSDPDEDLESKIQGNDSFSESIIILSFSSSTLIANVFVSFHINATLI